MQQGALAVAVAAVAVLAAVTVHAVIAVIIAVVAVVTMALSPRRCHRKQRQQQARRPAATAAVVVAAINVGGGSARIAAHRRRPLWPIVTAFPRRIGIISALVAAAVLPPHPHLPLPPATTGSVAVDVYRHDQLDRTHSLADKALAPMFPPGMGWVGGGGEPCQ